MPEDTTPEGQESPQKGDVEFPPWDGLMDLYLRGATSPSYGSFAALASAWLPVLPRVVPPNYGRKVEGDLTYPPGPVRNESLVPVRLDNGQRIDLRFNAYWDAPHRSLDKGAGCLDGGWYRTVEVRDVTSRTDKATLSALSVLEGSGVRDEGIERIRRHLIRGERVYELGDELGSEEERLLAFARMLLEHHVRDPDPEMLVETCKRVVAVAESARQLYAFVEYGATGRKLIPASKDPQMDVRAAELHHIAGMSHREVADKLRRKTKERHEIKGGHDTAARMIERGTDIFVRALGQERWERYRDARRREYENSEGALDRPN